MGRNHDELIKCGERMDYALFDFKSGMEMLESELKSILEMVYNDRVTMEEIYNKGYERGLSNGLSRLAIGYDGLPMPYMIYKDNSSIVDYIGIGDDKYLVDTFEEIMVALDALHEIRIKSVAYNKLFNNGKAKYADRVIKMIEMLMIKIKENK